MLFDWNGFLQKKPLKYFFFFVSKMVIKGFSLFSVIFFFWKKKVKTFFSSFKFHFTQPFSLLKEISLSNNKLIYLLSCWGWDKYFIQIVDCVEVSLSSEKFSTKFSSSFPYKMSFLVSFNGKSSGKIFEK